MSSYVYLLQGTISWLSSQSIYMTCMHVESTKVSSHLYLLVSTNYQDILSLAIAI